MTNAGRVQDQPPPWLRTADGRLFAVLAAILLFCLISLYLSLQWAEKMVLRSEAHEVATHAAHTIEQGVPDLARLAADLEPSPKVLARLSEIIDMTHIDGVRVFDAEGAVLFGSTAADGIGISGSSVYSAHLKTGEVTTWFEPHDASTGRLMSRVLVPVYRDNTIAGGLEIHLNMTRRADILSRLKAYALVGIGSFLLLVFGLVFLNVGRHRWGNRYVSERQPASGALEESETTLGSLYDSLDMMMGIVEMLDDDLLHISDNETAAKFFGTTADAMQMRTARELGISAANVARTAAHMAAAKEAGTPINYQHEYQRDEGPRILSGAVAYIGQAASGRDRYSYVVRDVTKNLQVETDLQDSRKNYQKLVEHLPDGIRVLVNGHIVFANPAAVRLFGARDEAELIGQHRDRFLLAADRERIGHFHSKVIGGQEIPWCEEERVRLDGSIFDVEASAIEVLWDGEPAIVSIVRDITEKKRAEESLRDLSNQNRLLLNAMADGIYGIDLKGRVTFVNPAAESILGWPAKEIIGKSQHAVAHHHHSDGTAYPIEDSPIKQVLRDGIARHIDTEVFWRKDGSSFSGAYDATPIQDDDGNVTGAVVSFRDITERKAAEEALRRSETEASRARQQLLDAIEAMADAFVSYDPEDRLVLCNSVYKRQYPGLESFVVPGISFEELARLRVEKLGDFTNPSTAEEREAVVQKRLEKHLNPGGAREHQRITGGWIRVSEQKMSDGSLVAIRTDITDLKTREFELRGQSAIADMLNRIAFCANQADSFAEVLQTCLDDICNAIGWPIGHVFAAASGDPSCFESMGLWHCRAGDDFSEFQAWLGAARMKDGK
ncbi:MAG: PAS domain S-box protein, partial [Proteobacteria bacterium]|nr:PAS domain S-box protein [Pseudomonadota bacterium]